MNYNDFHRQQLSLECFSCILLSRIIFSFVFSFKIPLFFLYNALEKELKASFILTFLSAEHSQNPWKWFALENWIASSFETFLYCFDLSIKSPLFPIR